MKKGDVMKISTKGRYALRVMLELAKKEPTCYVPLKDISKNQSLSEKYLESIIKKLVLAGYVQGVRGKGGGYRLTKAPCEYTVGMILRLMEGSLAPVSCLKHDPNTCPRAQHCETLPMWKGLFDIINTYFDGITLQDLLNQSGTDDTKIDLLDEYPCEQ